MSGGDRVLSTAVAICLVLPLLSALSAEIDFYRDVYPVLKANCISCHNKTTTKGKLNMESPEEMRKGGETGPGVIPGKGRESLVWQAAAHQDDDLLMPPKNNKSGAVNLTEKELTLLQGWIDQGARHSVPQARAVVWQPLPPGVNPIYAVALSRDGRYAVCGRANQIFVYDLATRQLVTRLVDQRGAAHRAFVQSLAFSPDGTRLASGSFREVKIWRLEQRPPPPAARFPAAVAPAAEVLLQRFAVAGQPPWTSHALSPDARRLVTGEADGRVRVWEMATAKPVLELHGTMAARRQVAALEWGVAAQTLELAFHNGEVARIEAQNKALEELLKKARETIVSMTKALPDKKQLAAQATAAREAAQKTLEAKSAQTTETAAKDLEGANEALLKATMAETSASAAYSAVQSNLQDAEASVQHITSAQAKNLSELTTVRAALERVKQAQATSAGELARAKQAAVATGAKPIAVAFSADGQRVCAVRVGGALTVWAVATGTPLQDGQLEASELAQHGPALPEAARQRLNAQPTWALERTLSSAEPGSPFADRVNTVCFSPDGKTLAVGGGEPSRSGNIALFNVASGQRVATWPERHADAVLCLAFSPDGTLLASGSADKIARVTSVATGQPVKVFEGHTHYVMGLAFRADGRMLATAGADGVVLIWDLISGERKRKIEGWNKEVTALQYLGASAQLLTCGGDNFLRIVSDEGTVVRTIPVPADFLQATAGSAEASEVVAGGEGGVLHLWDGTSGQEIAIFGAK